MERMQLSIDSVDQNDADVPIPIPTSLKLKLYLGRVLSAWVTQNIDGGNKHISTINPMFIG